MRIARLLTFLFIGLFLCGGCLEGERAVAVKYDPSKDSFSFLTIYHRIRSDSTNNNAPDPAADFKYLKALYRNRDHLIFWPPLAPFLPGFGNANAYLLVNDSTAANLSLSQPDKSLQPINIPLSGIQIDPGKFYLSESSCLCFFQQMTVPGDVFDQALQWMAVQLNKQPIWILDASIPRDELARRKSGQKAPDWKAFSDLVIGAVLNQMDEFNLATPDIQLPLETASIQSLITVPNHLQLLRRKSVLAVRFPLEADDVAEAVQLFSDLKHAVHQKLDEQRKAHGSPTDTARQIANEIDCINVAAVDKTTLEISWDLVQYITNNVPQPTDTMGAADAGTMAAGQAMTQLVMSEFDVTKGKATSQILRDFMAGTLPAYPQQPPVAQGTDLPPIK